MPPSEISHHDFEELGSLTRRVVPSWLRQQHHTLSIAGQAAEELMKNDELRSRFLAAMENSEKEVVFSIWIKFARRIRDRLKKRISRNREQQSDIDAPSVEDGLRIFLDEVDSQLNKIPDAQIVFREFYVPLIDCTAVRRPSIKTIQSFLGASVAWAREVRQRVEDAVIASCKD